uniref:Integrase catalytic domain-containing protein n=1 Tax=Amphimedon queenslandica TaxID=400682 RepID=A0A1X7U6J2_AMPQE
MDMRSTKPVAVATQVGCLYQIQTHYIEANTAATVDKEDLWHRRYGHLSSNNLQKLASEDLSKAKEPLDIVHCDICSKINLKSLSGAEYFLTLIDDKTQFVWVYVLKRKSDVFSKFCEWKAYVEQSTGRSLKVLLMDNGGEFTSNEFEEYLRKGVKHELTIPKCPQQNGVVERLNRTLVEMVKSMLSGAKLPQRFWAEALVTAVYLPNHSPTKAVMNETQFEALTAEKPSDEKEKLDYKSQKCMFLGYPYTRKGYRLYDLQKLKIVYSRDVIFNETEFFNYNEEKDQPLVRINLREEQVEETVNGENEVETINEEESDDTHMKKAILKSNRDKLFSEDQLRSKGVLIFMEVIFITFGLSVVCLSDVPLLIV